MIKSITSPLKQAFTKVKVAIFQHLKAGRESAYQNQTASTFNHFRIQPAWAFIATGELDTSPKSTSCPPPEKRP